jgi:hypothetical protein
MGAVLLTIRVASDFGHDWLSFAGVKPQVDAARRQSGSTPVHAIPSPKKRPGQIEPGKYADMVVLSGDILSLPEEAIKDVKAVRTIVEGHMVCRRQGRKLTQPGLQGSERGVSERK